MFNLSLRSQLSFYLWPLLGFVFVASPASCQEQDQNQDQPANGQRQFDQHIAPVLQQHCLQCHAGEDPQGDLELSVLLGAENVALDQPVWGNILERVAAGDMPPADAEPKLELDERQRLSAWIREGRAQAAEKLAGDPGHVPARRLSNAEYDYTIRDLTGVDIRPTRDFPVDPANAAGFDNSAESLSMSPALLAKVLEAARRVSDHLVFTPTGLDFAPHTVTTETDRDQYCVRRIVDFYDRQPTDLADYFFAAWVFRQRAALELADATLADIADRQQVSAKYLQTIWEFLTGNEWDLGPQVELINQWQQLPTAEHAPANMAQARAACVQMRDYVLDIRGSFSPSFDNLEVQGIHKGAQALVLWKNKQAANNRRTASFAKALPSKTKTNPDKSEPAGAAAGDTQSDAKDGDLDAANSEEGEDPERAAADRLRFETACQQFCSTFPNAFFIAERGRDYLGIPKSEQEKGRLLSAGFHSMMGYFRDDRPLCELILSEAEQRELNSLWQELDFFTSAPHRQYQGFLWFERTDSSFLRDPEFDFARPEDKSALSEPVLQRLAEAYLAKATAVGGGPVALQAIADYFSEINQQMRWVEAARLAAEPTHVDALVELAGRAARRPLTESAEAEIRTFYRELRDDQGMTHEEAIQDTLVMILMSPSFSYRLDLLSPPATSTSTTAGPADRVPTVLGGFPCLPLDDYQVACRLSYFLWSSQPDEVLMRLAEAGELQRPEVLQLQTQRMLADPRIRGLATEFCGNWLDFRRFEEHNSVDRERFPSFDNRLRSAMFEEPIHFFVDLLQRDRSILDCIDSDRTFVNQALSEHYRISGLEIAEGEWQEIADASDVGRGGLLPMAVFLTKNAPGLRTSPVKRGYWVVRRLLGEHIPAPPPNVPELPSDEAQLGELSLRESLAAHREHASCAGCHQRIDAFGLVFEGFGPIGERRQIDLGGRAIDDSAEFPDGIRASGLEGLRNYIQQHRQQDFVDNFCRQLLSYALGRTLQLSDESLLVEMSSQLAANENRPSAAVRAIVNSPQFLYQRQSGSRAAGPTDE